MGKKRKNVEKIDGESQYSHIFFVMDIFPFLFPPAYYIDDKIKRALRMLEEMKKTK